MKFGIREIIFVLVMLGLLGSSYFMIFNKTNEKYAQREADMKAKQTTLNNLKQATAGIDDLNRKIEELKQAITFFESKLPQEKEVDKILKEVWQIAEANRLTTRTIKTLKAERGANYSEQPIQMNLSGDFEGFYQFVLQLEKLPRITRVTQMKLTKIDKNEGAMQAQLVLNIYFEPETGARRTIATAQ